MRNIGCQIVSDFERPSKELVELFRDMQVANIGDCMSRTAAVNYSINPYNESNVLGTAFTVKVPAGDNLLLHKAMDMMKPGDVAVIAAGGETERAILGEIMITYMKTRGVAGILVDGCIRDADAISIMDIPVYAKGTTPNGPYKNGPGEINTVVSFAGQVVHPGDIVVGDRDGIIFIRPQDAEELAKKVQAVQLKEANIISDIVNKGIYPRPWVDEILDPLNCEIE
jgi:RraA family protein